MEIDGAAAAIAPDRGAPLPDVPTVAAEAPSQPELAGAGRPGGAEDVAPEVIVVGACDGPVRVAALVDALLAELRALSLEGAGREVLRRLVAALGRVRAGTDAAEARVAGALERIDDGGLDVVEVLRRNTGSSQREARRRWRRARALGQMPNVARALAAGDISTEHAEALARAAAATSAEVVDGDAELLVQVAGVPADRAGRYIEAWTQRHHDPFDLQQQHLRQRRRRRLNFGDGEDGMLMAHAAFDRVLGAQFRSLINGIADRIWRAEGGRDNPNSRSAEQRRLDALAIAVGLEPPPAATPREPAGHADTAAREPAGRADTAAREPAGHADAAAREPAGHADAAGRAEPAAREPAGHAEAAAREPAGRAEAAGREPAGHADAAGRAEPAAREPAGHAEAAAREPAGRADTAAREPAGHADAAGRAEPAAREPAGHADAAGREPAGREPAAREPAGHADAAGRAEPAAREPAGHAEAAAREPAAAPQAQPGEEAVPATPREPGPQPGEEAVPATPRESGPQPAAGPLVVTPRHQIVIVASTDVISGTNPQGRCEIPGVGPIPLSELERLACDAELFGLLFSGEGESLWHGRGERTATDAQRRALVARDGVCVLCADEPARCEAHHVKPWAKPFEGPTDIDNMALLCGTCHRRLHNHGRVLRRGPDGAWGTAPDPRFTGRRKPIRPPGNSVRRTAASETSACRLAAFEMTMKVEAQYLTQGVGRTGWNLDHRSEPAGASRIGREATAGGTGQRLGGKQRPRGRQPP